MASETTNITPDIGVAIGPYLSSMAPTVNWVNHSNIILVSTCVYFMHGPIYLLDLTNHPLDLSLLILFQGYEVDDTLPRFASALWQWVCDDMILWKNGQSRCASFTSFPVTYPLLYLPYSNVLVAHGTAWGEDRCPLNVICLQSLVDWHVLACNRWGVWYKAGFTLVERWTGTWSWNGIKNSPTYFRSHQIDRLPWTQREREVSRESRHLQLSDEGLDNLTQLHISDVHHDRLFWH